MAWQGEGFELDPWLRSRAGRSRSSRAAASSRDRSRRQGDVRSSAAGTRCTRGRGLVGNCRIRSRSFSPRAPTPSCSEPSIGLSTSTVADAPGPVSCARPVTAPAPGPSPCCRAPSGVWPPGCGVAVRAPAQRQRETFARPVSGKARTGAAPAGGSSGRKRHGHAGRIRVSTPNPSAPHAREPCGGEEAEAWPVCVCSRGRAGGRGGRRQRHPWLCAGRHSAFDLNGQ